MLSNNIYDKIINFFKYTIVKYLKKQKLNEETVYRVLKIENKVLHNFGIIIKENTQ